jgi:hypothetical protein
LYWWSRGRYDLGLTSDEFYSLTLRQLSALVKRHEQAREHQDAMLAQLTSCVINFSYRAPQKPTTWQDLMPGEKYRKERSSQRPRMTKKHRRAIADAFRTFFPKV